VKRSTSYHGLSPIARALLIELIDRYNGSNNGFIALGVREAAYEIGCSQMSISRAARELDDADLVRPTQVGAWRGRQATEWRLTWRVCNKTGQLPRNQWQERKPYVQLLLPAPAKAPLTNSERQRRWRRRRAESQPTERIYIAANDDDEPYCIGRVYYGPYPWNFTWEDHTRIDWNDRRKATTPEQWQEQNPDVSQEELARLKDAEFPF